MSVKWITLIPVDPNFIPDPDRRSIARTRLLEIASDADEVEIIAAESIRFFDCGANFEKVHCPSCAREIALAWRLERMEEDYENGYKLDRYRTPCCNVARTLGEFGYDWPQAFGRFALDAMSPSIGRLDDEHLREMEEILETTIFIVYQNI